MGNSFSFLRLDLERMGAECKEFVFLNTHKYFSKMVTLEANIFRNLVDDYFICFLAAMGSNIYRILWIIFFRA